MAALNLEVVPGTFAVTRLAAGSPTPDWAMKRALHFRDANGRRVVDRLPRGKRAGGSRL